METKYFVAGIGYVTKEEHEQVRAYRNFMCEPDNEFNCSECPENREFSGKLPCGQQNCWVTCHCK